MLQVPRRGLRFGFWLRQMGLWFLLLALAAGAVAGAIWIASDIPAIRRDGRVWASGREATDVAVRGKVQSKGFGWVVAHYDLTVEYQVDGRRHRHPLDFGTALGRLDHDRAPVVRYDPRDPDRFALNWAVDASGARWRWAILGTLIMGLLVFAGLVGVRSVIGDARAVRHSALTGEVAIATIRGTTVLANSRGQPSGKTRFSLSLPASEGAEARTWVEDVPESKARPLYADHDHTTVFVLVASPPAPVILLRDDLYPLSATAAERTQAGQAAEAHAAARRA